MLSDCDIREELDSGRLCILPYPAEASIQPASIDVHLGQDFIRPVRSGGVAPAEVDVLQPQVWDSERVGPGEPFRLPEGGFALGCTVETVGVWDSLAVMLAGRSSLGRLGLLIHSTAELIDPGFHGQITLELKNLLDRPLLLWPGMSIGQLIVHRLESPAERPYGHMDLGSKYQNSRGPIESRFAKQDLLW